MPARANLKSCVKCGKKFTPEGNWYQKKGQISCSEQCRSLYERSRVDAVIGSGKPLIDVQWDCIVCNICGETMKVPGTHLSRVHRIDLGRHLSMSERQIIYGLKQGERCVPGKYIEMASEAGRSRDVDYLREARQKWLSDRRETITCPPHSVRAPRSRRQEQSLSEFISRGPLGAHARRDRAQVEFSCSYCKNAFLTSAHIAKKRMYCSRECSFAGNAAIRSPEVRRRAGAAISAKKRILGDRLCAGCGVSFRPKDATRLFCSADCYHRNPKIRSLAATT